MNKHPNGNITLAVYRAEGWRTCDGRYRLSPAEERAARAAVARIPRPLPERDAECDRVLTEAIARALDERGGPRQGQVAIERIANPSYYLS